MSQLSRDFDVNSKKKVFKVKSHSFLRIFPMMGPPEAHEPPEVHGPRGHCAPLPPLSVALVSRTEKGWSKRCKSFWFTRWN